MRLFVTGGTGFIGGHFLQNALADGHEVCALKRDGSGTRIPLMREPRWISGEMKDIRPSELAGIDCVVHLAAAGVIPGDDAWEICFETNVIQSIALWRKALKAGVRRLVILGSCFEYGLAGEAYEFIPSDSVLIPTGAYHASKAAATMAAQALCVETGAETCILRPFHIFGEGEALPRLWPALRDAALNGADFDMTGGALVRDFMDVHDAAKVILEACTRSDLQKGIPIVENMGSGHPCTIAEFARDWWNRWGAAGALRLGAVPYRKNEVMRYVPQVPTGRKK